MEEESQRKYHKVLIAFMRFRDNIEYDDDHTFSLEELQQITPRDIVRWFNFKLYRNPDPSVGDLPIHGRSNSLLYYKKALSFFMPHRLTAWNPIANVGNPTRSAEVNAMVKQCKKREVRKQGKASQARRELEGDEYCCAMNILKAFNDPFRKYTMPAINSFQYNMIARLDDCCKFMKEDLKGHKEFDFALSCRMCWSKNVHEERDAPDQILLASDDPLYCVLLWLSIHLETNLENGVLQNDQFVFGDGGNNPDKVKKRCQKSMSKDVWKSDQFIQRRDGNLGTHSGRKYPATVARRRGATQDELDCRGRWKRRMRISSLYTSVDLPFQDAKVAALLCQGGAVKYKLVSGSQVNTGWLLMNVVPRIREVYGDDVARVLGLPLLWACFEPGLSEYIPSTIRNRVLTAFSNVRDRLPEGANPVKKVPVVVSGSDGVVVIEEIPEELADAAGAAGGDAAGRGGLLNVGGQVQQNAMVALYSQVAQLRRDNHELRTLLDDGRRENSRNFRNLNSSLHRVAMQPVRRAQVQATVVRAGEERGNDVNVGRVMLDNMRDGTATLSPTPRNLYVLWDEYEFGIGGRKAAKHFSRAERGRCKHKYARRKVVWDIVSGQVNAGVTAQLACDRIYEVYGREKTVTDIINRLRRDKMDGNLHPLLTV